MEVYRLKELSRRQVADLCRRNPVADATVMAVCREVFEAVRRNGDEALTTYTRRFDGVDLKSFQVTEEEFEEAARAISGSARQALEHAARNIERFHASQHEADEPLEVEPGVVCWREERPIESVGLYVPGGTAVLPSSVLMLGIPASLAGCSRIVLSTPPGLGGRILPEALVAARLSGISEVYKLGGAQGVAALALGTAGIPAVEKILGPGNRWVQGAKLLASLEGVAIDMVAGPSEVLVVADSSAKPAFVAADLISQAEHGRDSRAILVSTEPALADQVERELDHQLQQICRRKVAGDALRASFILVTENLEGAFEFSNQYAPEHLILQVRDPKLWVGSIRSAGSVFLGPWSPVVAGDYASGTNHTLPTSGLARTYSGVSLESFQKKVTFQKLSREGLEALAPTLEVLADVEGLEGHRRAVEIRRSHSRAAQRG